jgi:SAM-dependent methyltransferase
LSVGRGLQPGIQLVCPACRTSSGGGLEVRRLSAGAPGTLGCACGAVYPIVDGIPIVRRDLAAWLATEGPETLRRRDLPPAVEEILVEGTGGAVARNDALAKVYGQPISGGLRHWMEARAREFEGTVLELGSGLGLTGRTDVVALDHNFGLLRLHRGWARVCADAGDPPFLAGSFDVVILANVLDACANPGLVLAQADALLAPGGRLVVTCAFAFHESITPRAHWFDAAGLDAALRGEAPLGTYAVAGHTIVEHAADLAWPLALSPRLSHVHSVDVWTTRKPASPEVS